MRRTRHAQGRRAQRQRGDFGALDDSESVFATAAVLATTPLARHSSPAPICTPNTERLYRRAPTSAISVGQVAGQILAYHLALGEQIALAENRIKFSAFAGTLVGLHRQSETPDQTAVRVVAAERGGEAPVEFGDDFRRAGGGRAVRSRVDQQLFDRHRAELKTGR